MIELMTRTKHLLIVLGLLALLGASLLISHDMRSGEMDSKGVTTGRRPGYTTCRNASTTDSHGNEYGEIVCGFEEIRSGDAFLVDMGQGKQIIFMYAGTDFIKGADREGPGADGAHFDTEQTGAWRYQVVGGNPVSKSLTVRISDESDRVSGFSFRDMNFDGYPDLIDGTRQGAGANSWRLIFWFDPVTNTFKASEYGSSTPSMNALVSESDFNVRERTMSQYGASGYEGWYQHEYRFQDRAWVLVGDTYSAPDESGKRCITEEGRLIDGKMVKKKTSVPRDQDEHC